MKQPVSQFCAVAVVLALGYTAVAAPPGLVGYWTFDEGQGQTAFDSSGNGLDGTLNGDPQWVAGQLGGALDFDGSGDFVEIPHDPLLSITDAITIAAWTNMRATASGEMAIVSKGGWGANDLPYELTETAGDVIFWQFYDNEGRDTCSPDSPPVGEWHHICATYDGAVFKCYIDGELGEEWEYAGAMPENTASVTIGRRSRGGTFFNGMIDDVAIYNRALSEEEIGLVMEGHLRESPLAYSPSPRDGGMIDQKLASLTWQPGQFAVLHEVYFGESLDEVHAATPDDSNVFVGRQAVKLLSVGTAGGPYPEGLEHGKTYYWRVDEVNDVHPDSPWKGDVWSFQVRPLTAFKPYPANGMRYVDPNQDLSWEPGVSFIFHYVHFGESFDQVSNAPAPTGWPTVAATHEPGPLKLDTTYYWRIDEFLGAVTHIGEVWSFTTRDAGGGAKAEYFDGIDLTGDPVLTQIEGSIDHSWGSGEIAAGLVDSVSARWRANLQVPFTETYRLITTSDDGVRLWLDGLMVIDNWTDHGTTDNTAMAEMVAGQIYSIRMEWYESGGGAVAQLSWASPSLPRQIVPQGWLQLPLWATGPSPAHGTAHAVQTPVLQWIAGDEATHHDIYFGEDGEAVATADPTTAGIYQKRQAVGATSYNPGTLEWGKTYYWRVDEINEGNPASPWKGAVWSFTTADFLVIDDFESYTDDYEAGQAIFQTWIDGLENNTGSYVGYEVATLGTFGERKIVHDGRQSMPLAYDNAGSPYYSEISRTWTATQNWTVNGVDTLTVHFRGKPGNGTDRLYVALEDSTNNSAVVVHPDSEAVLNTAWTVWRIPLSDFVGVNATRIKTIYIGLGDRKAPSAGGAGQIYVDDIRVTKSAAQ